VDAAGEGRRQALRHAPPHELRDADDAGEPREGGGARLDAGEAAARARLVVQHEQHRGAGQGGGEGEGEGGAVVGFDKRWRRGGERPGGGAGEGAVAAARDRIEEPWAERAEGDGREGLAAGVCAQHLGRPALRRRAREVAHDERDGARAGGGEALLRRQDDRDAPRPAALHQAVRSTPPAESAAWAAASRATGTR
jgi:hypothetical protein